VQAGGWLVSMHLFLICNNLIYFNARLSANPNVCEEKKNELLFMCPKTCKYCDEQGLFCEDFYLKKCTRPMSPFFHGAYILKCVPILNPQAWNGKSRTFATKKVKEIV